MLLQWVVQYLEEYRVAVKLLLSAQESVQHVQRWIPPPMSVFKFNVDGVVFAELNSVGVRVMVRDWNPQFLAAISKKIHAPLGPLEAKAKAFELGRDGTALELRGATAPPPLPSAFGKKKIL